MTNVHQFPARSAALPLPMCIEVEQGILGAVLLDNTAMPQISQHVSAADFGEPIHARIFDVASRLIADGRPATPATLRPYLGDSDLGEGLTVGAYLARLCREAMPASGLAGDARIVRDFAVSRAVIALAGQMDQEARALDVRESPHVLAARAIGELQRIVSAGDDRSARGAGEVADDMVAMVESVRSGATTYETVTTGYRVLDQAMNGFEPGTLVVIAGRPGMGKTIFMNSSGRRCAQHGTGVLEFPLEVGAEQLAARHLADLAYSGHGDCVEFRNIGRRGGDMTEEQLDRVRRARDTLRSLPIVIDGRSRLTVPQITAKVIQTRIAMAGRGVRLGVVFVDHLDFIHASDRYAGNRTQEIGEICLALKDLARSEGVCVVLLSQLNRELEKRGATERRPSLADLRNSGDIEQVADVVAFLYRPEYYLARDPKVLAGDDGALDALAQSRGKLDVILGKVRAGPTPTIPLFCAPASSSISNFARGQA